MTTILHLENPIEVDRIKNLAGSLLFRNVSVLDGVSSELVIGADGRFYFAEIDLENRVTRLWLDHPAGNDILAFLEYLNGVVTVEIMPGGETDGPVSWEYLMQKYKIGEVESDPKTVCWEGKYKYYPDYIRRYQFFLKDLRNI